MKDRFRIQSDEKGKRLDVFLAEKLSTTRSKVKELFDLGLVTVEGKVPKPSFRLRKGVVVEGEIPEEKPATLAPEKVALDILYEDDDILAINKPKGMVVHPSFGHSAGTLVNAALGYLQDSEKSQWVTNHGVTSDGTDNAVRPGIVHRLDKDTTGVILVAKSPAIQEMLSHLFKERKVRKTYRAVVEGTVRESEGLIRESIGRHPLHRKQMAVVTKGGRESETAYSVLEELDGYTYIEVYPRTGRTHQIRVHMAYIGHPVVGDSTYGRKAKHLTDRPLLHAYAIEFVHPTKRFPVRIEAAVPEDLARFVAEYGSDHEKAAKKISKRKVDQGVTQT